MEGGGGAHLPPFERQSGYLLCEGLEGVLCGEEGKSGFLLIACFHGA